MAKWMDKKQKWYESCVTCMNAVFNSLEFIKHDCSCIKLFWCDYCCLCLAKKEDIIGHVKKCNTSVSDTDFENLIYYYLSHLEFTGVNIEKHIPKKKDDDKLTNLNSNVKSHKKVEKRTTYETGKKFTCRYCKKQFAWSSNLRVHLRIHTGEKPFTCNYCKKGFTQSSSLQSHLRIHTGEKPFTCNYCKKGFTQSSSLQSHLPIHTGEKPFTCNYCKKQFARSSNLRVHLRIHTGEKPFTCNYCKKEFTQSSSLQSHLRIHTGEKPFTCNYCKKGFTQSDSLQRHLLIHTGEKPFTCNY